MAYYHQTSPRFPVLCTSQYSILHQERLYLLQALADEEERGERLTKALGNLQSKLENPDKEDPQLSARKLKTAIKTIRNKIGKCQHRERVMSGNLQNVIAQMEGLKRYQWRSAHQQYNQQSHYSQLMMSPAAPNLMLQSPLATGIAAQMQYMALKSPYQPNTYATASSYGPFGAVAGYQHSQLLSPASSAMSYPNIASAYTNPLYVAQNQPEGPFVSPVSSISPFDLVSFSAARGRHSEIEIVSPLSKCQPRPWSWPSVIPTEQATDAVSTAEEQTPNDHRRRSSPDAAASGTNFNTGLTTDEDR